MALPRAFFPTAADNAEVRLEKVTRGKKAPVHAARSPAGGLGKCSHCGQSGTWVKMVRKHQSQKGLTTPRGARFGDLDRMVTRPKEMCEEPQKRTVRFRSGGGVSPSANSDGQGPYRSTSVMSNCVCFTCKFEGLDRPRHHARRGPLRNEGTVAPACQRGALAGSMGCMAENRKEEHAAGGPAGRWRVAGPVVIALAAAVAVMATLGPQGSGPGSDRSQGCQ